MAVVKREKKLYDGNEMTCLAPRISGCGECTRASLGSEEAHKILVAIVYVENCEVGGAARREIWGVCYAECLK